MESPKKIPLHSAIIAILVLLNICTIAFFLLSPKPFPPQRCEDRREPALLPAPMEKELGFSEEQRLKFAELQRTFGMIADSLHFVTEKANRELFDLVRGDKVDEGAVRQKIAALTAAETAEKWQVFTFGRALRALCTPGQRAKMESMPPGPMGNTCESPGMPPRPQSGSQPQVGPHPPGGPGSRHTER